MKQFLIFISFFFILIGSFAQQKTFEGISVDTTKIKQKKFDKQSLETYKNNKEFNYNVVKKEKNFLQRFFDWLGRIVKKILSWIFDDIRPAVGLIKSFLSVLPYILLAILLYFIIKFFLKVNVNNLLEGTTKISGIQITDEEELIKNTNLEALINKAITDKNYRLAVRYYYLFILQKLTKNELIIWQQEKTNEDYIKELRASKVHNKFKETTHLYDFVWYGNFNLTEKEFAKAKLLFINLSNKIDG